MFSFTLELFIQLGTRGELFMIYPDIKTQILSHELEEQLICGVCEALQLDVADLCVFMECWWDFYEGIL